jgi:hypothetical protein
LTSLSALRSSVDFQISDRRNVEMSKSRKCRKCRIHLTSTWLQTQGLVSLLSCYVSFGRVNHTCYVKILRLGISRSTFWHFEFDILKCGNLKFGKRTSHLSFTGSTLRSWRINRRVGFFIPLLLRWKWFCSTTQAKHSWPRWQDLFANIVTVALTAAFKED